MTEQREEVCHETRVVGPLPVPYVREERDGRERQKGERGRGREGGYIRMGGRG